MAQEQGVAVSRERYQLIPRVLCFVFAGETVLLLRGAADKKIWPGRYNGLGGHVERGESVQAAAAREIWEEAGLRPRDLRLRGVVVVDTGEPVGIGLYVFSATAEKGTHTESAEGSLEWVPLSQVEGRQCVADVPALVRRLAEAPASAPPFSARYWYNESGVMRMTFEGDEETYPPAPLSHSASLRGTWPDRERGE
jgi:8-oxo-dGTP diphosphatase